ncbi:hypothetical protein Bca4012_010365 [Brassica carinata]|uniref:Uncharacterized protein n=1 Tax=Brassica carinata TaxID=52824 RepID=A0A8X7V0F3_BRACI|nr:hypothetical protein Bca52824_035317 [Brassica carinata]
MCIPPVLTPLICGMLITCLAIPLMTVLLPPKYTHSSGSLRLKWELKQKPGLSPPRGGFDPEDSNQQIVAENIFDEYGGEGSERARRMLSCTS